MTLGAQKEREPETGLTLRIPSTKFYCLVHSSSAAECPQSVKEGGAALMQPATGATLSGHPLEDEWVGLVIQPVTIEGEQSQGATRNFVSDLSVSMHVNRNRRRVFWKTDRRLRWPWGEKEGLRSPKIGTGWNNTAAINQCNSSPEPAWTNPLAPRELVWASELVSETVSTANAIARCVGLGSQKTR